MIRLAMIDDATGQVVGEWRGEADAQPAPVAGRTYVPVDAKAPSVGGMTWRGGAVFEARTPSVLSRLAFRERFTPAERATIRSLCEAKDVEIQDAMEALTLAEYIDLADARIQMYLGLLVTKGVLTAERATAIAGTRAEG